MMKLIVLSCLVAIALSLPVGPNEPVAIISQENNINPDGSYRYSFESADGTRAQQEGRLLPPENKDETEVVGQAGSFSYIGTDGQNYEITYVADKEGYKPQGAHLPVAPPVPEAIARSIEFNLANTQRN
ncbi:larval cuticle protein 65Ag1 [Anabrus simplex]|uniref:larval cuticle protein 65Ag1 n=1 Tax=Anabrus simplex TaxID=316456 RepID=UPI0035A392ED